MLTKSFHLPIYEETKDLVFTPFEFDIHLDYLRRFPDHEIRVKSYRKGFFTTDHLFEDGLHFNIVWKTELSMPELNPNLKQMHKVLMLKERNQISVVHIDIWGYSKPRIVDNLMNLAFTIYPNPEIKRICNQKQYVLLEHDPEIETTIPDIFFEMLVDEVNNHIKFHQYLEETKKNDNMPNS